jgi:hypothetical protein
MRIRAIGTARATLLTAGFLALGVSAVSPASAFADTTDGDGSVLGGNQVSAPISAPINACGNALALFGTADGACKGGAKVKNHGGGGNNQTSGRHSVLGGNQVSAPISAPVNVCGNAVAVFGSSAAGCKGGAKVKNHGGGGNNQTSGRHSVGGGNQIIAPITAPVNVCGNSAAVLGDAVAFCKGGAEAGDGGYGGSRTSGRHSVLGGNQVKAPITAPVNVCGNAVGNAVAFCKGGAEVGDGGDGGDGDGGGGGHYSRKDERGVDNPVAPGLPVVSGMAKTVPMSPAGALPAFPELPATPQLPVQPPAAQPQRAASPSTGKPVPPSELPANGLPELPVRPQNVVNRLPQLPGGLPDLPGGTEKTRTTPVPAPAPAPAPAALPDLPGLPVGGDTVPPVVTQHAQHAQQTIAGQKVTPTAADETISSGMQGGSLFVLTVGALLAGASAAMAVARRIRFGRH